ncbi:MAG: choice-of-anchor J domain-containing protein [Muribaculaceae bacterium]|nr:choice-of-anchor J domain-containing protein [Muribaculaceae bacterium]
MKRKLPLAIAAVLALPALAAVLPFTETFESGLGEFTVEDANHDEVTFERKYSMYGGFNRSDAYIKYVASSENQADDWLFTPAFELKKGFIYELSYQYQTPGYGKTNRIEWKAGKTASSESMTVDIAEAKEYGYIYNWTKETVKISVPEDGEWYIGLHLISMAEQGDVYLDQFEISEGINEMVPMAPEVSEPVFSIVGEDLYTSFEIEIPSTTVGGNPIEESVVEIFVAKDEETDFGSVKGTPGTTVTFVDSEASTAYTTYTFHTMINGLESDKVERVANPRFGYPKAVENFTVAQDGNEFTLSWDAVTEPTNASYLLIPSKVTYLVRCNGEIIANNTSELTTTYIHPMPEQGQESVNFTIVAFASGNDSQIVTSDNYMVGDPYAGEFHESFANRTFSNNIWVIENEKGWRASIGSAYNPVVNPQDEDGGCLEFALNGSSKIWSPVLDLSTLQNPKVKFYAYLNPSSYYETSVQPGFLVNGKEIPLGDPISLTSGTEGWSEFILDVPSEAQEDNCQLMFNGAGESQSYGKFFIDNISIMSYLAHNLAVGVTAPAKSLEIGQEVTFPVSVENKGTNTESGYTLTLFADGEKVDEVAGPEVEPMLKASVALSFKVLPKYEGKKIEFTVVATLEGDGDEEDNEAQISIPVNNNDLERVQTVNATLATDASKVTLEWTAPEVSTEPTYAEVTESFEDWDAGSMEGQDGWILLDCDNEVENGFNSINSGKEYAAMVTQNVILNSTYMDDFISQEGLHSLVISEFRTYGKTVDNRIISPEVKAGSDVSFYSLTYSQYGTGNPVMFSILWSAGGTEKEDFIVLDDYEYVSAPVNKWNVTNFTLPTQARRFAIQVTGQPSAPVMFDSFTFTASSTPAVHTGFNVYRDHELLATYPAETLSHVDEAPVMGAEHTYHVTALYDKGESHYSEPIMVTVNAGTQTGITTISAEMADAEFFTLQGLRIAKPAAGEIVIVRKGGKTFKAIVK